MAKQDISTELKQDEFSKIFDDYRAKIEEITRRTENNLHSLDAKSSADCADEREEIELAPVTPHPASVAGNISIQTQLENVLLQKAEPASKPEAVKSSLEIKAEITSLPRSDSPSIKAEITPPARNVPPPEKAEIKPPALSVPPPKKVEITPPPKPETVNTRVEVRQPVFGESSQIIFEAKREAKQIIEEAEESAKKEAKKRTQSQVDKIIEKARKEAEDVIARANKSAEKVRDDVIGESKREADAIIREITQKYRQETEAKTSLAVAEAREKAGKMLADVSASTIEVGKRITEIVSRAKQTIGELETTLQAEIIELTRIISETRNKLEEANKTTIKEEKHLPPPPKQPIETKTNPTTNPTLTIRLIGEKTGGINGSGILFSGQIEMKSASASFDYVYLKKIKKYLVHIPKIKYLQEYASEKEMSVLFDILEPLPLLDILSNIPMVDEVITRADDNICLVFKTTEA